MLRNVRPGTFVFWHVSAFPPSSRPLKSGRFLIFLACGLIGAGQCGAETVLFPFDDEALPLSKGLILTLMPGRKSPSKPMLTTDAEHPGKPVLSPGKKGDPDALRAYFFGSVLKVGKQYHMWYSGHDGSMRSICYAQSDDGLKWTKPKLGLVEYKKRKENNLVAIDGGLMKGMSALVVHDPEDPDPARRFKMIREINPAEILAAVSPDGLNWTSAAGNIDIIKGANLEPSGFIRHKGVYYLNGHGGPVPHPIAPQGYLRPQKRMMVTLMSYDFENWTEAGHVSFRRDPLPPRAEGLNFETHSGEQVHLGASLWGRGNVILGFYGQWHNPTNDRRTCVVDLGLVVSRDGIHFKEPIPDFKIVPSFEEDDRAEPRLTQGQAFQNIRNRTILYYGIWTENDRNSPTGVRIATWPRDRLGCFAPATNEETPHCISSLLKPAEGAKVFINATDLSAEGQLNVEVLDEAFHPLPGYAAANFVPFTNESGLHLAVTWKDKKVLEKFEKPVRLRVNWTGAHPQRTRLYAVYLE